MMVLDPSCRLREPLPDGAITRFTPPNKAFTAVLTLA